MSNVDLSQLAIDRSGRHSTVRRRRRHLLTRYILPGILIAGFVLLLLWASRDLLFPPRPVQVIPVFATQTQIRSEGAELFNAAGWIEPRPTAIRVAALAPGVVEQLLVVEDQFLSAGDPVAELVKDDAQLVLQRAIADRELAQADLEREQAMLAAARIRFDQPVHLEAKLAEADADLAKVNTQLKNLPFETRRAEARHRFAQRDYDRNVSAASSLSKREIDQSRTELETAGELLQELKDRALSLQAEKVAIGARREALSVQLQLLADETEARDRAAAQVKAARARLQQMHVAEEEAKLLLSRMTIKAPVDGRVYQLIGLPGARVGEGVMTAMQGHDGSSIITMYQPGSLQIRVDVRFEDIPKVQLGQPVRIDNPALSQPIFGSVLFISSEADIQKNTLQVKVAIESPPEFFKPEMLLDATFLAPKQTSSTEDSAASELKLYLPDGTIHQSGSQSFVWVADQSSGRAVMTVVEKGPVSNAGMVEIVNGIDIGSRVIASNVFGLADGDRIIVAGEENTSYSTVENVR